MLRSRVAKSDSIHLASILFCGGLPILQRANLWLQPIDGSASRQLTKFESGTIRRFSVSPDFKQLVIVRGNPSAEAVLISDFQLAKKE